MAMGAETSKFMGPTSIWIIDRTCHWIACENENKDVVLSLKEQAKNKKTYTEQNSSSCHLWENGLT